MQIKCIITDDEPIARKGLRGYIEKIDLNKSMNHYLRLFFGRFTVHIL
jgi:hypothetical protein